MPRSREHLNVVCRYTGFPYLGVQWQGMQSPALRSLLKMKPHHKGVLIKAIAPTSLCRGVLQPRDVIMRFDDTPVANDGTVPYGPPSLPYFPWPA